MKNPLHKFKIYKYGFTLAEVLITLVIIGVIAALTIPAVINNTKDQEFKSQFAKAYSTIMQAIHKTEMNDFFGYAQCYYLNASGAPTCSECRAFYDAMAKNLHVQKICKGNSKADGCVPTYQIYQSGGCPGFNQSPLDNDAYSYVLSDGQIIIVYKDSAGTIAPLFLIDINGHKAPNAYGKDLFAFMIAKNDSGMFLSGNAGCFSPVKGGRSTTQMILYALAGKK